MSFWESFANLLWIWIEGDIWLSLALIKIIRWFIAKLWMICKPWRRIKVMVSWQRGFYWQNGNKAIGMPKRPKKGNQNLVGSSICVAYEMWVHLKVRHLDIYCRRVVSVVGITFLAKPFPPLHQLPFWLQQRPQFCPCDVEHKSHHKVFEATCTQGCIIEFPLTGVSKVYRIVKTDERLMSMTTATAPNVEALIWCTEWSSSREVV